MRRAAAIFLALALPGCVSDRVDADGTIQTTSEANRDGIQGAVSAPLRDINVVRTKIPDILLVALSDPYGRLEPTSCQTLTAEIMRLNEVLGADLDEPPSEDGGDLIQKGKDAAANTALGMVAGAAQDLIPLRGWVRRLTGAQRHDRLVSAAITAGGVRRGYLKGLGESRGCNPPATPLHKVPEEPIEQTRKPRYPVR